MTGKPHDTRGLLDWALKYAARGWHVFPVYGIDDVGRCCCGRPDCSRAGKHPMVRGGFKSASVDETQISRWWRKWPQANIGVATGRVSNLWVLDVDNAEYGGNSALEQLQARYEQLPVTLTSRTGSGTHLVFSLPFDVGHVEGSVRRLGDHLDVRADDGYIVVPPSLHRSGTRYAWVNWPAELAVAPEWLIGASRRKATRAPMKYENGLIGEGDRNRTLYLMGIDALRRGVELDSVDELLLRANCERCDPPLPAHEVESIARSVQSSRVLDNHPCTDCGNGDRIVAALGDRIRYVDPPGEWLYWDSKKWAHAPDGKIAQMAASVLRRIPESANCPQLSAERRRELDGWARASQSMAKIRAAVEAVSLSPFVRMNEDDLDADPDTMNVSNGILDLSSGQLREHEPRALLSKIAGAAYHPDARSSDWDAFVETLTCGDPALLLALQCACGYAMSGAVTEHVAFILFGEGANGKSTFLSLIQRAFGDYGATAPPSLLSPKRNEVHPTEMIELRGRRIVCVQEVDFEAGLDEARFKYLTGGDRIKARRMRQDFVGFEPSHTLFVASNHPPRFRDRSRGMSRRVVVFPTNASVKAVNRDPQLFSRLNKHLPAIIRWCVDGALAYQEKGRLWAPYVQEPAEKPETTATGTVRRFVVDQCEPATRGYVLARELHRAFLAWCTAEKVPSLSEKAFGIEMVRIGYEKTKVSSNRYLGLQLKARSAHVSSTKASITETSTIGASVDQALERRREIGRG